MDTNININDSNVILLLRVDCDCSKCSDGKIHLNHSAGGTPLGVQVELAPTRKSYTGMAHCSPYERSGMCESVYGYPASKISLGPIWI